MTLSEEIFDEMKCGKNPMFAVGIAAIAMQSPDRLIAALRGAMDMYQRSNYHELGPLAQAAAKVSPLPARRPEARGR